MDKDEIICTCFDIYKSEIVNVVKTKPLLNLDEVMDITGAGKACGLCHESIQKIIDEEY